MWSASAHLTWIRRASLEAVIREMYRTKLFPAHFFKPSAYVTQATMLWRRSPLIPPGFNYSYKELCGEPFLTSPSEQLAGLSTILFGKAIPDQFTCRKPLVPRVIRTEGRVSSV